MFVIIVAVQLAQKGHGYQGCSSGPRVQQWKPAAGWHVGRHKHLERHEHTHLRVMLCFESCRR